MLAYNEDRWVKSALVYLGILIVALVAAWAYTLGTVRAQAAVNQIVDECTLNYEVTINGRSFACYDKEFGPRPGTDSSVIFSGGGHSRTY